MAMSTASAEHIPNQRRKHSMGTGDAHAGLFCHMLPLDETFNHHDVHCAESPEDAKVGWLHMQVAAGALVVAAAAVQPFSQGIGL